MATQKKIDTVQELTDKIGKAKSIVFAEYGPLKHKQLEALRKALRAVDAEIAVTKNTLMERALGETAPGVKDNLKNATATLFSYKDEVSGLKELLKFFKQANIGKTKGGLLGTSILSTADVNRLSKLPGRQELLARLAGQMLAPISGLHHALSWNMNRLVWALDGIKNKKTQ